jgi:hypothetical protein
VNSKRKLKQKKRRAEKRARLYEEPASSPAQELLARITLERRVRHDQNSQRFQEEQEKLWLAEERRNARQRAEGRGRGLKAKAKG